MEESKQDQRGRIGGIARVDRVSAVGRPKPGEIRARIAVLGIIIEDKGQAEQVNSLLHQYGRYIIGRMGLPYEKKQINIISVVVDAPADVISALSGKLGRLPGRCTPKLLNSQMPRRKQGSVWLFAAFPAKINH